jgi:hypothetical protein
MVKWFYGLGLFAGVLFLLVGCGSKTTPVGPLSAVDFRAQLPAEVAARAPSDADAQQYQTEVKVGDPPARVLIRWRAFKDGANAYLLSVAFEVVESAPGVELTAGARPPLNMGTANAVLAAASVTITWYRQGFPLTTAGAVSGQILADGSWRAERP